MILDLTWTRRVCMTSSHKCSRGYANDGDVAKYILTLYNKTTNQVLSDTPLHSNIVGSLFQIRRPFFKYWLNAAELGAIIGDAGGVLVRHRQRRGFSTVKWNQFLPSSWTTVERQLNDSWTTVERLLSGSGTWIFRCIMAALVVIAFHLTLSMVTRPIDISIGPIVASWRFRCLWRITARPRAQSPRTKAKDKQISVTFDCLSTILFVCFKLFGISHDQSSSKKYPRVASK